MYKKNARITVPQSTAVARCRLGSYRLEMEAERLTQCRTHSENGDRENDMNGPDEDELGTATVVDKMKEIFFNL